MTHQRMLLGITIRARRFDSVRAGDFFITETSGGEYSAVYSVSYPQGKKKRIAIDGYSFHSNAVELLNWIKSNYRAANR